jgi:hypothetical protein
MRPASSMTHHSDRTAEVFPSCRKVSEISSIMSCTASQCHTITWHALRDVLFFMLERLPMATSESHNADVERPRPHKTWPRPLSIGACWGSMAQKSFHVFLCLWSICCLELGHVNMSPTTQPKSFTANKRNNARTWNQTSSYFMKRFSSGVRARRDFHRFETLTQTQKDDRGVSCRRKVDLLQLPYWLRSRL